MQVLARIEPTFTASGNGLLCLLLAIILSPGVMAKSVRAADFYVSPSGDNLYPGTISQPWRTISRAASALGAGDTVYLRQGVYNEQVIPGKSGTSSEPITYTVYPGETATIDGRFALTETWSGLLYISGREHLAITGLTFTRAGPYVNNCGILIENSNSIIVENNTISDTVSSGIGVWNSRNITIKGNEVVGACNDGEQECITIAGTVGFEVASNHVHHNGPGSNGGEGIDAKDGSSAGRIVNNHVHDLSRLGIYVDAWENHTFDIEISGNRIHNCENDGITLSSEQGGLLENISVFNNIIYNNRYSGISITPNGDAARPLMKELAIYNNSLFNNGDNSQDIPWGGGIVVDNPTIEGLDIFNNILSENLMFQVAVEVPVSQLRVAYNLIDGFRGYEGEMRGSMAVSGSPRFISPSTGDFRLNPFSPAIDTGTGIGAPGVDFDRVSRPQGKGYDIGAYEVQAGSFGQKVKVGPNLLLLRK